MYFFSFQTYLTKGQQSLATSSNILNIFICCFLFFPFHKELQLFRDQINLLLSSSAEICTHCTDVFALLCYVLENAFLIFILVRPILYLLFAILGAKRKFCGLKATRLQSMFWQQAWY